MDSGSLAGGNGSNDSLNGLKFGKKIYFEDVGGGGGSSSKASALAPPLAGKRGKGVAQGGQQPPRCQVEGCRVDLSDAKTYYVRHKVCGMHSKAPKVIVGGLEQRFCQQCSRFHQLAEFDQGKRSCRRRLAGHNERRRKPPTGSLSSRIGWLSSFNENNSKFRSFLMDFTHPGLPGTTRDVWPMVRAGDQVGVHECQGGLDAPTSGVAPHEAHPYIQSSTGGALFSAPGATTPGEHLVGVSDSSCALSLLSTQPWGSVATRNIALTLSGNSSYAAASVAEPSIGNSYVTDSWGLRGHEIGGRPTEVQHEMGLAGSIEPDSAHCSGQLELSLQGNRLRMNLEHGGAYRHSDDVIHWSL